MGSGRVFFKLAFLSFISLLCACTTIKSHNQRVKLASEPEGAKVYLDGQLIGSTPGWIEIPRRKQATLTIEKKGFPPVTKELRTSYRWGDSFFSNFVWFIYGMPVATVLDYLDNTAWEYDKVGIINLSGKSDTLPLRPPRLIAVAPPHYEYELLSNEVGERLIKISRGRFSESVVRDFDKTHNLFAQYGFNNEFTTPDSYLDYLYEELNTSHIVESEITKEGKDVVVKSSLVDAFTDRVVRTDVDKIPAEQLHYYNENNWARALNWLVGVIPNTVSFDLAQPTSQVFTSAGTTYTGVSETTSSIYAIISGLGFKSLDTPKLSRGIRPVFKLIPLVTMGYDQWNFSTSNGPTTANNYNFYWATVVAGFGPEVGFDTSIGYFYAEVAPTLSMNWITASAYGIPDTSARGTSLAVYGEIGYSIFASNRINLRFFSRFESVPPDVWSQVLTQINGQPIPVDHVTQGSAGLSIGYYFPEDRIFLKRALFPY